jgi:hypothetical protein
MTPTLFGRWQTRLFLFCTVGLLVTWIFASGWVGFPANRDYYWVLFYLGAIGLLWDILYNFLQQFLWDHDWPGALQFLTAIVEGAFVGLFFSLGILPFLDPTHFNGTTFVVHYGTAWLAMYLSAWVVMRILFPRWRFRGGEWIGKWRKV